MAKDEKKNRRQWLFNDGILTTKETSFDLTKVTEKGAEFLKLYGGKQYLVDPIASKGGNEYSDQERKAAMEARYDNLCNENFEIIHTESGFYFKDPNAVAVKKGGIKQSALYDGLIEMGKTHEEAIAFITKIKS